MRASKTSHRSFQFVVCVFPLSISSYKIFQLNLTRQPRVYSSSCVESHSCFLFLKPAHFVIIHLRGFLGSLNPARSLFVLTRLRKKPTVLRTICFLILWQKVIIKTRLPGRYFRAILSSTAASLISYKMIKGHFCNKVTSKRPFAMLQIFKYICNKSGCALPVLQSRTSKTISLHSPCSV